MAREPEKRIEVEPLSEARWARVERAVFAKLDEEAASAAPVIDEPVAAPRGRARVAAAIVAACAVAAAVGGLVARSVWRSPAPQAGSHIVTAQGGSHVALAEAALDVGQSSELEVSGDDDHGVLVVLDRGRVDCEVAPRQGRPPFVVKAGEVRVRVVGTRFAVQREATGVHVEVQKGVVEVESHGEVERVSAGQSWPSVNEAPAAAPATAVASAALTPAPTTPAPASSPRRATSTASHPIAVSPSKPVTSDEEPAPQVVAPPVAPRAPAATSQERYESAARIESTDPDAALAIYGDLARGDDAWSANALFASGRLEADRGQRDRARELLGRYLARFPRGANAADARDLLDRIARGGH
jgi:hypothetical protein